MSCNVSLTKKDNEIEQNNTCNARMLTLFKANFTVVICHAEILAFEYRQLRT